MSFSFHSLIDNRLAWRYVITMDKLPILPEHVVALTVDDLESGQVAYLPSRFLLADRQTHQPCVNRNTLVYAEDFQPERLIGHFAIMRVVLDKQESDSDVTDAFVIDIRALDPGTVRVKKSRPVENSSYATILDPNKTDSPETARQLNTAAEENVSIVGIVNYDENAQEQLRCFRPDVQQALLELIDYTDNINAGIWAAKHIKKPKQSKMKQDSNSTPLETETTNTLDSHRPE